MSTSSSKIPRKALRVNPSIESTFLPASSVPLSPAMDSTAKDHAGDGSVTVSQAEWAELKARVAKLEELVGSLASQLVVAHANGQSSQANGVNSASTLDPPAVTPTFYPFYPRRGHLHRGRRSDIEQPMESEDTYTTDSASTLSHPMCNATPEAGVVVETILSEAGGDVSTRFDFNSHSAWDPIDDRGDDKTELARSNGTRTFNENEDEAGKARESNVVGQDDSNSMFSRKANENARDKRANEAPNHHQSSSPKSRDHYSDYNEEEVRELIQEEYQGEAGFNHGLREMMGYEPYGQIPIRSIPVNPQPVERTTSMASTSEGIANWNAKANGTGKSSWSDEAEYDRKEREQERRVHAELERQRLEESLAYVFGNRVKRSTSIGQKIRNGMDRMSMFVRPGSSSK